jgi:hypothetical protein
MFNGMRLKAYQIKHTDAGRIAGEKLDCTVRSYSLAFGISYELAHAKLKAAGRKDKHRFNFLQFMLTNHKELKRIEPSQTIATFLTHGAGRIGKWIILIRGHVFTSVDGVAYDTEMCKPGMRITDAWHIKESVDITIPQVNKVYTLIVNDRMQFEYPDREKAESMGQAFLKMGNYYMIHEKEVI